MFQPEVGWVYSGKTGPLTLSVYSVSHRPGAAHLDPADERLPRRLRLVLGPVLQQLDHLADRRAHPGVRRRRQLAGRTGRPLAPTFAGVKIRTISLASPSGDLLADSKVVFSSTNHWCDQLQLTADGKTVFCGGVRRQLPRREQRDRRRRSSSTRSRPAPARLVYRLKVAANIGVANILWLSPNGSSLLAAAEATDYRVPGRVIQGERIVGQAVDLITKGILKPIKLPLSGVPLAGQIAF